MSDPADEPKEMQQVAREGPEPGSINLTLVYSLLAVALLAAILFAVFVVFPFYVRR